MQPVDADLQIHLLRDKSGDVVTGDAQAARETSTTKIPASLHALLVILLEIHAQVITTNAVNHALIAAGLGRQMTPLSGQVRTQLADANRLTHLMLNENI